MAFLEREGVRLYYEDTGGSGPVVLFLHGAGGNHLSWWQQLPVFAEQYRCERYAGAGVPTLFLTSDEDGLIWPELSEAVHRHVAGSSLVRVEGAGHSTYFERPDVFNREVGAFLDKHRPA